MWLLIRAGFKLIHVSKRASVYRNIIMMIYGTTEPFAYFKGYIVNNQLHIYIKVLSLPHSMDMDGWIIVVIVEMLVLQYDNAYTTLMHSVVGISLV